MSILSFFSHVSDFLGWRDCIEILFFSSLAYGILHWLKRDKRSNLLPLFYSYCGIIFLAHLLQLTSISIFLSVTAPIIGLLFIILHQDILQRNFISLRTHTSPQATQVDWMEITMRSCLIALNNKQEILGVIENTYELQPFLKAPFLLQAPIQEDLMEYMVASSHFERSQLLWLSTQGILKSVNSSWHFTHDEAWQSAEVKELPSWQQDALLMTSKTDAIVFKTNSTTRTFDIVIRGKLYRALATTTALALIKKYLHIPDTAKGDYSYDSFNQKESFKQSTP